MSGYAGANPTYDTGTARDIITDFSHYQGDKIDLSGIDANNNSSDGDQAFSFIGTNAFSAAGQLRYMVVNGNTLLYGNTDSNFSTTEFELQLNGVTSVMGTDFIL